MIPNGAQIRQQRSKTADFDRLCPAFSGKRLHEHQGSRNFKGSRCFCRVVPEYFPHQGRRADRADQHDVQQAVRRGKAAGGKRPLAGVPLRGGDGFAAGGDRAEREPAGYLCGSVHLPRHGGDHPPQHHGRAAGGVQRVSARVRRVRFL